MHTWLPLLIMIITLAVDIYTDLRRWDSGRINHGRGLVLRTLPLVLAAVLSPATIALWPLYMAIFDAALNIGRHLPIFRIGETAWVDRMQRRYPGLIGVKWALVVFGIILYIWL